jgi:hypothetical protein
VGPRNDLTLNKMTEWLCHESFPFVTRH